MSRCSDYAYCPTVPSRHVRGIRLYSLQSLRVRSLPPPPLFVPISFAAGRLARIRPLVDLCF